MIQKKEKMDRTMNAGKVTSVLAVSAADAATAIKIILLLSHNQVKS